MAVLKEFDGHSENYFADALSSELGECCDGLVFALAVFGQADVGDIKVDSEEFTNKEGRQVRVSTIEITLNRK